MKKLITFAAVFTAVAVQAAAVSWKADKQTALKNYNYAIVDPAVITALVGGASPYSDASAMATAIAAGEAYDANGLANFEKTGTLNAKGTASGFIDNVGATFTMVFWSGTPVDGGSFLYGTFSTAGMTYEGAEPKPGDVAVTYDALSSGTFTAATYTQSGGQDPIPEPTTVALLALGLAAVGLKRKVA